MLAKGFEFPHVPYVVTVQRLLKASVITVIGFEGCVCTVNGFVYTTPGPGLFCPVGVESSVAPQVPV